MACRFCIKELLSPASSAMLQQKTSYELQPGGVDGNLTMMNSTTEISPSKLDKHTRSPESTMSRHGNIDPVRRHIVGKP